MRNATYHPRSARAALPTFGFCRECGIVAVTRRNGKPVCAFHLKAAAEAERASK